MNPKRRTFKLFFDNGFVHCAVWIWWTRRQYQRMTHCKKSDGIFMGGDHFDDTRTFTGKIGDIHLMRGRTGSGVVTHEITHAVNRYFRFRQHHKLPIGNRRCSKDWVSDAEESFCYVMGNVSRQFWQHFYACKTIHRHRTSHFMKPVGKQFARSIRLSQTKYDRALESQNGTPMKKPLSKKLLQKQQDKRLSDQHRKHLNRLFTKAFESEEDLEVKEGKAVQKKKKKDGKQKKEKIRRFGSSSSSLSQN